MAFENIWNNFTEYVSSSPPYAGFREKLLAYFGNPGGRKPGFRHRALGWYNPVSDRFRFNCGYRMCINAYLSCDHGCGYCYVNAYSGGVGTGRRRPGFTETLRKDISEFKELGMPQGPVHMSNSTDPFQERLERRHRDAYNALEMLAENRELFSEITILTKNPGFLFVEEPSYLSILEIIRDRLNIEITIPFFRDNYKGYEPNAPHPRNRLDALARLVTMGFTVRLRLDPVFPRESGIQTNRDISNILDCSLGVQCVISKPLRLVIPKTGIADAFFNEMQQFYQGGRRQGVEKHGRRYVYLAERCETEMGYLSKECAERNIPLLHCKETVLVDEHGTPIIRKKLCE